MSLTKAILIINAKKKGWTEEARKKAAMARKRRSSIKGIKSMVAKRRSRQESDMHLRFAKDSLKRAKTYASKGLHGPAEAERKYAKFQVKQSRIKRGVDAQHNKTQARIDKQEAQFRKKHGIPDKGEYVVVKGIRGSVPAKHINSDESFNRFIKSVEKKSGKKVKRDSRTGFPSFVHYKDGREVGAG